MILCRRNIWEKIDVKKRVTRFGQKIYKSRGRYPYSEHIMILASDKSTDRKRVTKVCQKLKVKDTRHLKGSLTCAAQQAA